MRQFVFVLVYSSDQVICYSDIQCMRFICEYIDEESFHFSPRIRERFLTEAALSAVEAFGMTIR